MITVLKPTFKSIEVDSNGEIVRLNVGDNIKFNIIKTGEEKNGVLVGISGVNKKGDFSLVIIPEGESHKETWEANTMVADTLQLA